MPQQAESRKTLLITAVGSGVGRTLLQALQGRRQRLRVLGLNSRADAPELYQCDAAWLGPETARQAAHQRRLIELIEAEQPDLVLAGRDEDVAALATLREARPHWAPRLLVGSLAAARVLGDKRLSAEFALARGLPFVPTVGTDAADAAAAAQRLLQQHGYPLIAKPTQGNGSRGVRVLLNPAQLARALARPGLVLQPMIDPPVQLQPDLDDGVPFFWGVPEERLLALRGWVARDGAVHWGCGYRMTMVIGRYERMEPVDDTRLCDMGLAYGRALSTLGWCGPFHLQCKQAPGGPMLPIELNGRLGGGTAGRRGFGYDELGELLNHWLGAGFVPPDITAPSPLVLSRQVDCVLPAAAMAQLQASGQWRAGPLSCD